MTSPLTEEPTPNSPTTPSEFRYTRGRLRLERYQGLALERFLKLLESQFIWTRSKANDEGDLEGVDRFTNELSVLREIGRKMDDLIAEMDW